MPTERRIFGFVLAGLVLLLWTGCVRERTSENEPIHINPNMDNQPKYRPQSESKFFADGSTMRVPVTGTIAAGELYENVEFYTGRDAAGILIASLPDTVKLTRLLLERGQVRFNIYCSPCHGRVGDGKSMVVARGLVAPPTFHSDTLRAVANGYIFDIITNGIKNMPAYKYQIPVDDRWAIVAYFRALQLSQNAKIEDIPQRMREKVQ